MQKSLYTAEYTLFLEMLREQRERAVLTQIEVAERLGATQSFVSKCERGERRLDVIELRDWCKSIGISPVSFMADLEKRLAKRSLR